MVGGKSLDTPKSKMRAIVVTSRDRPQPLGLSRRKELLLQVLYSKKREEKDQYYMGMFDYLIIHRGQVATTWALSD